MKTTFSFILASCVAAVLGQGVTDPISPSGSAPAGCSTSYDGSFEVTVVKVAVAKRDAMDVSDSTPNCSCFLASHPRSAAALREARRRASSFQSNQLTSKTEAYRLLKRWHPRCDPLRWNPEGLQVAYGIHCQQLPIPVRWSSPGRCFVHGGFLGMLQRLYRPRFVDHLLRLCVWGLFQLVRPKLGRSVLPS